MTRVSAVATGWHGRDLIATIAGHVTRMLAKLLSIWWGERSSLQGICFGALDLRDEFWWQCLIG